MYEFQAVYQHIFKELHTLYSSDQARVHAYWIIDFVFDQEKTEICSSQSELSERQFEEVKRISHTHVYEHKPLAYLFGTAPFLDLELMVREPLLIPRPETEEWCERLIREFSPWSTEQLTILDVGTGSGCIALALAKHFPLWTVHACDISPISQQVVVDNALKNKITNLTFYMSDLYSSLPSGQKYDLVISNPPYISLADYATLDPSVKKWEDPVALIGGDTGLEFYQKLVAGVSERLKERVADRPQVIFEIGYKQARQVSELLKKGVETIDKVTLWKDLAGHDRVVIG